MSYLFDGASDRISLANPPASWPTAVTIVAWIKPNATFATRSTVFSCYSGAVGEAHGLFCNIDNKLYYEASWSGGRARWSSNTDDLVQNVWQGVAASYDGSSTANNPILYRKPEGGAISALTVTKVAAPSGTLEGIDSLWIGGVFTSYSFPGRLAYIRYFDSVLTQAQIDAELDAAAAVLTAQGDWPLTADANDLTANNRDGTLLGDTVLDADNPTLGGGGATFTQGVSGASTNAGDVALTVHIDSLAGASTNSGTVNAVLIPSGGGPTTYQKSVSGSSSNSGALFTRLNPTAGGSGFPMRFLQPRTE